MNFRSKLLKITTFLGGIYFFLEFLLPAKLPEALGGGEFGKYHQQISNGVIAVGAVTFALGLINLLYVHGSKIVFRKKGLINSAVLLISMFLMLYIVANEWMVSQSLNSKSETFRNLSSFAKQIKVDAENKNLKVQSPEIRTKLLITSLSKEIVILQNELSNKDQRISDKFYENLQKNTSDLQTTTVTLNQLLEDRKLDLNLDQLLSISSLASAIASERQKVNEQIYKFSNSKLTYDFVYEGLFVPLGSAMFSLLGFYIISAGYRAFRIRSAESALMMIAAVLVMLGQIPFYIYISEALPEIRLWLLEVPSAAAFRAVKFGAAIASLYMAIRMWLSIETQTFSSNEEKSK